MISWTELAVLLLSLLDSLMGLTEATDPVGRPSPSTRYSYLGFSWVLVTLSSLALQV